MERNKHLKPVKKITDKIDTFMVCPECGHHPIIFSGKRTLTWKTKSAKTTCPNCMYEEDI